MYMLLVKYFKNYNASVIRSTSNHLTYMQWKFLDNNSFSHGEKQHSLIEFLLLAFQICALYSVENYTLHYAATENG